MSFNNRSNALIELLEELNESDLQYVLVGGYAVSAFNARFSKILDTDRFERQLPLNGEWFQRLLLIRLLHRLFTHD